MNQAPLLSVPLVIDLDGTLMRSDVLYESTLKLFRTKPYLIFAFPFWLFRGKLAYARIEIDCDLASGADVIDEFAISGSDVYHDILRAHIFSEEVVAKLAELFERKFDEE